MSQLTAPTSRRWLAAALIFVGYGVFFTGVALFPYYSRVALVIGLALSCIGGLASLRPNTQWAVWYLRSLPSFPILAAGMRFWQASGFDFVIWFVVPIVLYAGASALLLFTPLQKDAALAQRLRSRLSGTAFPAVFVVFILSAIAIGLTRSSGWQSYYFIIGLELILLSLFLAFAVTLRGLAEGPEGKVDRG